jgi:hypothetical protein
LCPFFLSVITLERSAPVNERVGAKQIAIRVPLSLGKRLEAMASRENNHVSAVTRRLLSAALDREDRVR